MHEDPERISDLLVSPADHGQHVSGHAAHKRTVRQQTVSWNAMRTSRRAWQTNKNVKQPAAAPKMSAWEKAADSENMTEMIPRQEARGKRPRSKDDAMHDRNSE